MGKTCTFIINGFIYMDNTNHVWLYWFENAMSITK